MKLLLGTEIIRHLLLRSTQVEDIQPLFYWSRVVSDICCIDTASIAILTHECSRTDDFNNLNGLVPIRPVKPKAPELLALESVLNQTNYSDKSYYKSLFAQLNVVISGDADILISENQDAHHFAKVLNIENKVYRIDDYCEKCANEKGSLEEIKGCPIEKVPFRTLNISAPFFESFKRDYPGYCEWFNRKSDDDVYVVKAKGGSLLALLKMKIENETEDYSDIKPTFKKKKRLKISSLKVSYGAQKLGQRFMKIVFDTAIENGVSEIYGTVFPSSKSRLRLIGMLEQWGFKYYGKKGDELVYCRNFSKMVASDPEECYPFHSISNGVFIAPISFGISLRLFPTNSKDKFEIEPLKQAIRKVYVVPNDDQPIRSGSVILFCNESGQDGTNYEIHIGVVNSVCKHFSSEYDFCQNYLRRDSLLKSMLHDCWVYTEKNPLLVEFLYVCPLRKIVTADLMMSIGLYPNSFIGKSLFSIDKGKFLKLIKDTSYEKSYLVNQA